MTDWNAAVKKFQPMAGNGDAQRAGLPGYGSGSVPYAPGATSFTPSPPQPMAAPAEPAAPPQGSGYQESSGFGATPGAEATPAMGGYDPQRAVLYARYLMDRLKLALNNQR